MSVSCQKEITINVIGLSNATAYWKLDEAGTNIERFDSVFGLSLSPVGGTSSPVTGIINNGVQITNAFGRLRGALGAPGTGASWLNLPYPAINGASISMWLKWSGVNPNLGNNPTNTVVFLDGGGIATGGFVVRGDFTVVAPPQIGVDFLKAFQAVDQSASLGSVVLDTWNHVVMTYNQVTHVGTVYLNGALASIVALATWIPEITSFVDLKNFGGYFVMNVDELGVYNNVVLSQTEVTSLFNSGAGRRPPNVP